MTPEQIREIVKITLDELQQRKQYKPVNYSYILQVMDKRLYDFFSSRSSDSNIASVLRQLSDDEYVDIIYLQYRDHKTMEWIAEYFERDLSTIKRNKKRLITKIYEEVIE